MRPNGAAARTKCLTEDKQAPQTDCCLNCEVIHSPDPHLRGEGAKIEHRALEKAPRIFGSHDLTQCFKCS